MLSACEGALTACAGLPDLAPSPTSSSLSVGWCIGLSDGVQKSIDKITPVRPSDGCLPLLQSTLFQSVSSLILMCKITSLIR